MGGRNLSGKQRWPTNIPCLQPADADRGLQIAVFAEDRPRLFEFADEHSGQCRGSQMQARRIDVATDADARDISRQVRQRHLFPVEQAEHQQRLQRVASDPFVVCLECRGAAVRTFQRRRRVEEYVAMARNHDPDVERRDHVECRARRGHGRGFHDGAA